MRFFSIEGTVYQFISRFWDLVKLNVLWVVFSLPLVTCGAATVAAYSVTLKMVKDEDQGILMPFLRAFKANFKQATMLWAVHLLVAYLVYLNLEIYNKVPNSPVFLPIAALIIGFFGLMHLTYAFVLCASYHNTLLGTLKNAAAMATTYFVTTLMLWTVVGLLIFLFLYNAFLLYVGVLIGPSAVFLTVSGFASHLFGRIEKNNPSS